MKKVLFFSYIRLRRVLLRCSDIRLAPSDIALRAVLEANIKSLPRRGNITDSSGSIKLPLQMAVFLEKMRFYSKNAV